MLRGFVAEKIFELQVGDDATEAGRILIILFENVLCGDKVRWGNSDGIYVTRNEDPHSAVPVSVPYQVDVSVLHVVIVLLRPST
jgi:hypothetical protein